MPGFYGMSTYEIAPLNKTPGPNICTLDAVHDADPPQLSGLVKSIGAACAEGTLLQYIERDDLKGFFC